MSENDTGGIGDRIRRRRKALRMSQKRLAEEVTRLGMNLSQQNVNSIEAGGVVRPRSLPEMARVLGTTIDWLQKGIGPEEFGTPDKPARVGRHYFSLLPSAHTKHPHILELIPSKYGGGSDNSTSYSFYMSGAEMSPVIEHGDEIGVYPHVWPAPGMDCVFLQAEAEGKRLVTVGRLMTANQTRWVAMHFNPEQYVPLPKETWIAAHPIAQIRRAKVVGDNNR